MPRAFVLARGRQFFLECTQRRLRFRSSSGVRWYLPVGRSRPLEILFFEIGMADLEIQARQLWHLIQDRLVCGDGAIVISVVKQTVRRIDLRLKVVGSNAGQKASRCHWRIEQVDFHRQRHGSTVARAPHRGKALCRLVTAFLDREEPPAPLQSDKRKPPRVVCLGLHDSARNRTLRSDVRVADRLGGDVTDETSDDGSLRERRRGREQPKSCEREKHDKMASWHVKPPV